MTNFYLLIGLLFLTVKQSNTKDDYEQLQGMDVDKISLMDDLSQYPKCSTVILPDSEIMQICQNNSICRLLPGPNGYMQVFCDCSNTITETHYFMGPRCETKMALNYSQNVSGFLNTSWLEDLFALNAWKNDFSRVGPLY